MPVTCSSFCTCAPRFKKKHSSLDTALASCVHEAHIGDNYDLNPTVWSIFLVQHVKAMRNGGWTAESAHIQELLSFENLYGWNKAKRSMFAIRVHNRTSGETNACATKIHGNLQIQKGWETVEKKQLCAKTRHLLKESSRGGCLATGGTCTLVVNLVTPRPFV